MRRPQFHDVPLFDPESLDGLNHDPAIEACPLIQAFIPSRDVMIVDGSESKGEERTSVPFHGLRCILMTLRAYNVRSILEKI